MAGIFSLRNWVMKQLMKQDKSGIMKIPDKGKVDFGEMLLREQLFQKGIDPKMIKNEKQLDNILDTPVVPKSERAKPKKSGKVIEVDFDKGRWNKAGGGIMGNLKKKYQGSTLQALINNPKLLAAELGHDGLLEMMNMIPFNKGGRAGLSYLLAEDTNERMPLNKGGGADRMPTDYEKFLFEKKLREMQEFKNYMKNRDIEKRQREFFQMNTGTGTGPTLEAAEGGRIGYAGGGMGRRAFLKLMAALGATGVAAKSGLAGLFKSGAKKKIAKDLTEVPIKNIKGMPSWFKPLVNKVIKEGTEVPSGAERVIVHKTKLPNSKTDVYVNQDLNNGDVWVDIGMGKHGWADGHYGQPVRLEYKASEVIEPTINTKTGKVYDKGGKTKDEFWVEEAEWTGSRPEDVKFEESTFEKFGDHGSNFDEVEMFATGKVKKSKPTKKRSQTEWEQDKAQADAEAYWEEHGDYASGGIARLLGE